MKAGEEADRPVGSRGFLLPLVRSGRKDTQVFATLFSPTQDVSLQVPSAGAWHLHFPYTLPKGTYLGDSLCDLSFTTDVS